MEYSPVSVRVCEGGLVDVEFLGHNELLHRTNSEGLGNRPNNRREQLAQLVLYSCGVFDYVVVNGLECMTAANHVGYYLTTHESNSAGDDRQGKIITVPDLLINWKTGINMWKMSSVVVEAVGFFKAKTSNQLTCFAIVSDFNGVAKLIIGNSVDTSNGFVKAVLRCADNQGDVKACRSSRRPGLQEHLTLIL